MPENFILKTDSYKLTHWQMYPEGTEYVFSYFEARYGAQFDETMFFGLQDILFKYLEGVVVTQEMIDEAEKIVEAHLGDKSMFNREGWEFIVDNYGGRLPIRIRAVPEGVVVPVGNVLMTVENTDPDCAWLTNYIESLLTHVWYPSTVATLSYNVKKMMHEFLEETSDNVDAALAFMLHDFGYRGAATDESAAIGGAGHLINFRGTDTLVAMELLVNSYNASLADLAFSVPATEHSVMTALGREGENQILDDLINKYPSGILSVVADSYDIYYFVESVISRKDKIKARDGRFVVRPDSTTPTHKTPAKLSLFIVSELWEKFGGYVNNKGYKVLDDQIRVLWGDGIDIVGINLILNELKTFGFSAENMVFGMGGGLLQKVNRDTQRFAFKSSAQKRNGEWFDVVKEPLDSSKRSKGGRLNLWTDDLGNFYTVKEGGVIPGAPDSVYEALVTVFENGEVLFTWSLDEIRKNSEWNPAKELVVV